MTPAVTRDDPPRPRRLLRMKGVTHLVPLSPPRIYALIRRGQFPTPVKIHGRSVAWFEDEVQGWMASRERAGRHT